MKAATTISEEDKRRALDAVLGSETFARSDKLKQFLRYICEVEISGQAASITEHTIGVEALGRRPGYSTGDDSIVRSTAYVLRQKLLELYEKELPEADPRIELHKGSYVPMFVTGQERTEPAAATPVPLSAPTDSKVFRMFAYGFGTAALLAAVLLTFLVRGRAADTVDPIVSEAWGPLAVPGSRVMMFVGHPPHLLVRPYKEGEQPTDEITIPVPREAYAWYQGLQPLDSQSRLYSYVTGNSCLLGDAFAAVNGARMLARLGVSFQIVPERTVRLPVLRGTNALLFGNPDYSPAIAALLANAVYSLTYDPVSKLDVVTDKVVGRTYAPRPSPKQRIGEAYGIITVFTLAATKDQPYRTIIFSGVNSAGTQAATEFFTSVDHLRQLKQLFLKEGQAGFPSAYQVLVKSTTETSIPISISYESHHILKSNGSQP